jgi:hypothetical protein
MAWGEIIVQSGNQRIDRKEHRQYVDLKAYLGRNDAVWWWVGDYAEDEPISVDMSPEYHNDVKGKSFTTIGDIKPFDTYYVSTGTANNTHDSTNFFQNWLTEIFMSGKEMDLINSVPMCYCYTYLSGNSDATWASVLFPKSTIKFISVGSTGNSNLSIGIELTGGGVLQKGDGKDVSGMFTFTPLT